jgi:hypothetical protein
MPARGAFTYTSENAANVIDRFTDMDQSPSVSDLRRRLRFAAWLLLEEHEATATRESLCHPRHLPSTRLILGDVPSRLWC